MFDVTKIFDVWIDSLSASRIREPDPILKFWFAGSGSGSGRKWTGSATLLVPLLACYLVLLPCCLVSVLIPLLFCWWWSRLTWCPAAPSAAWSLYPPSCIALCLGPASTARENNNLLQRTRGESGLGCTNDSSSVKDEKNLSGFLLV